MVYISLVPVVMVVFFITDCNTSLLGQIYIFRVQAFEVSIPPCFTVPFRLPLDLTDIHVSMFLGSKFSLENEVIKPRF